MTQRRKTVFISCGQYADEERQLGKQVCEMVSKFTDFDGYFAENQATLKALSENVLRQLYDSVGLVIIMHHRGKIEERGIIRASVWIEQEVAIATLMEQVLNRPLHVALFVQRGIAIEGVRQQIQLNPIEFTQGDEVIARLREILLTWKEPLYIGEDERRKLVDSVIVTIKTNNGHHRFYTISVKNHSTQFSLEVKGISLWSKNQRISSPVVRPDGANWTIDAGREIPINFDAGEDVARRLWMLAGSPSMTDYVTPHHLPGHFDAEVRVDVTCEVLGIEKMYSEIGSVQVDPRNHAITGL